MKFWNGLQYHTSSVRYAGGKVFVGVDLGSTLASAASCIHCEPAC